MDILTSRRNPKPDSHPSLAHLKIRRSSLLLPTRKISMPPIRFRITRIRTLRRRGFHLFTNLKILPLIRKLIQLRLLRYSNLTGKSTRQTFTLKPIPQSAQGKDLYLLLIHNYSSPLMIIFR